MSNFITNQKGVKTLKTRLKQLTEHSEELKFLSGFFYFSGWQQLYDSVKERDDLSIKILVGLEVDHIAGQATEIAYNNENLTKEEKADGFFESLDRAINHKDMDIEEFHSQVSYFLKMIEEGKLHIRKTFEPNHAKLYIFKIKNSLQGIADSKFITGSSNLTQAGVEKQNEFNVEIGDYGTKEAEEYFDELWETAVKITENDQRKDYLVGFMKNRSQAANITPFEAYAFTLKTYIDLIEQKKIQPQLIRLLEKQGYKQYSYQIDAVNQALSIIEEHNGVIVADVVGLGKSIIGSMIGKSLGKRGMVICPPGLMGDKNGTSGWKKYIHDFKLNDWEVRSGGSLENISDYLAEQGQDIEVIIIDEAHRYRNQDTAAYEALNYICRNRKIILLTATPFNNSPIDIFSLLKLFIIPGQSGITIDNNIERRFAMYDGLLQKLSFIIKHHNSTNLEKREKAKRHYFKIFASKNIDINRVKERSKELAREIRTIIEPILIRRNRIDLQKDFQYKKEIKNLSKIKDPEELLFELTKEQSDFYDEVIDKYFAEDGLFNGAIYQPFNYEKKRNIASLTGDENRESLQQRNLYDFMRRLLVKRFESSFGAFARSINNFERVHKQILAFIENSRGKYILDRSLLEKIYEQDEDEIEEHLERFSKKLEEQERPKNHKIYNVNEFTEKGSFLDDINSDLKLFAKIREKIEQLNLTDNDPKAQRLIKHIQTSLKADPKRKIIIFTEYTDSAKHLEKYLKQHFESELLSFTGTMTSSLLKKLNNNFDAGVAQEKQENNYSILLASDKISEGFNLNRAGTIINYDIPWNPTRVIQRVGRINRIGQKVFDELYLYNFFPTIRGADVIKSKEIAAQKMFLIHNTLGEDSKIFTADETPSASELYKRLTKVHDEEDESLITRIRNIYHEIQVNYPEVINKISLLPARLKTAKEYEENQLVVLRRKGISLFIQLISDTKDEKIAVESIGFAEMLPLIECKYDAVRLNISSDFWENYEKIKKYKPKYKSIATENSLETKALNCMQSSIRFYESELAELLPFIRTLITDLREYLTLPKYTLRRLSNIELTNNSKKKDIDSFIKEVRQIKRHLGDDYLSAIKEKALRQKKEIIIAIENIKK